MSKAIVFDVGRVLVDFSFEPFETFLKKNGSSILSRKEFYEVTSLFEYEAGKLSSQEFVSKISTLLHPSISHEEIVHEWTNIFSPKTEMIEFCKELHSQAPVYIMSNTNQLHWDHLEKKYNLSELCIKPITSHQAGAMKPSEIIYKALEKESGCAGENILFIDDLVENVEAGRNRGWDGVVHSDFLETQKRVVEFLGATRG